MVIETIVSTINADGTPHLSPLGPVLESRFDRFELRPFAGSRTLENLRQRQAGVVHLVDDAQLFVNALTHEWPELPPLQLATEVAAPMLKDYLRAFEFRCRYFDETTNRISIVCETVAQHIGRPPRGLCRGLNAVVEACILVSRVDFLPREEIETQLPLLEKLVQKTGNASDQTAMQTLLAYYARLTGSEVRSS